MHADNGTNSTFAAAADVPVFVLCGGRGTRMQDETDLRPKPMVEIGGRPILWHILRWYAGFGFRRFVLCLGYKAEVIRSYFLNYTAMNTDCTVDLASSKVVADAVAHDVDWQITLIDTGLATMTGARVARAAGRHLGDAETFAVTYGDGLTNADLGAELAFHREHGRLGTVLGVNPPSRFGELQLDGDLVTTFDEKPQFRANWINGGFFLFQRRFLEYVSTDPECVLERAPLAELARDRELCMHKHPGFWACMDTQRDRDTLEEMWASGDAPWAPKANVPSAKTDHPGIPEEARS